MTKPNRNKQAQLEHQKKKEAENTAGASSSSNTPAVANQPAIRTVNNPTTPPTDDQLLQAINDDIVKPKGTTTDKRFRFDRGYRTDFGRNGNRTTVETNYLGITTRPQKIHVYKLFMVREYRDKKKDGKDVREEVMVTRRTHKQTIFQCIREQVGRLRSQKTYATDFDMIWSVAPLFDDKKATSVPPPFRMIEARDPITGKLLTAERVDITYDGRIDLDNVNPNSMGKLFLHQIARKTPSAAQGNMGTGGGKSKKEADEDDDPAVLTRAINAFVTNFARDNTSLTTTNANTFYINDSGKLLDASHMLKALKGFFVSLRPGSHSLMLNVNVRHSPFFKPVKLVDFIEAHKSRSYREVRSYLIGRIVHISDLKTNSAHAPSGFGIITAVGGDGQQKYKDWKQFGRERGDWDWGHLLINVGRKKHGKTDDDIDRPEYYQAAVLTLRDNQPFPGTLTGEQTTNMLDVACRLPRTNRADIMGDGLRYLGISTDLGRQALAEFGLTVSNQLMQVPARVLNPPSLVYQSGVYPGRNMKPAAWNLADVELHAGRRTLNHLPVFDLRDLHKWDQYRGTPTPLGQFDAAIKEAFKNLAITSDGFGVAVHHLPQDLFRRGVDVDESELHKLVDQMDHTGGPVMVILPKQDFDLYSSIKRLADHKGVHTVCVSSEKFKKFGEKDANDKTKGLQYFANVGMKFNLKMGNDNQRLGHTDFKDILERKPKSTDCQTIIIGADVTHPPAGAVPGCPSLAAVVGTVDDNYVKYPGSVRLQLGRQEVITDLADMVKERLIDWAHQHQRELPKNILFYRDGVSESQYEIVRKAEIAQVEEAFKRAKKYLASTSKPSNGPPKLKLGKDMGKAKAEQEFNLTFVVVGKRHNTRFYATSDNDSHRLSSGEKKGTLTYNVKPGTVVDRKITHPYSDDFFLQSHEPLNGTGRSAHYFVLKNAMQFAPDELQRVTHSLCYIYARATKGVSYCAPAYYADRLCDRGRAWLRPWLTSKKDFIVEKDESQDYEDFQAERVEQISKDHRWNMSYPPPPPPSEETQQDDDTAAEATSKMQELTVAGPSEQKSAGSSKQKSAGSSTQTPAEQNIAQKYGGPRKNPWHPNLDGVMFYL